MVIRRAFGRKGRLPGRPADRIMDLSETQIRRYARHILLPEIGGAGQARLLESRVLVVGAGGLGSPLLLYLAAAGIGTLGVIDDDRVELSNLQRQVIHDTAGLGRPKVASAAERIAALNPDVRVEPHDCRLAAANAPDLIARYDLVVDGSDNFATRFLLADACHLGRRPLISGALFRFDGQVMVSKAFAGPDLPCYRCLFPAPPPDGTVPNCSAAGVMGALAGLVGALQAIETVKDLLGIGRSLAGRLLIVEALGTTFRTIRVRPDPDCPLCGPRATIKDLSDHA